MLKYNLQLVLEKARALEADVRGLKEQAKTAKASTGTFFYQPATTTLNTTGTFLTLPTQASVNLGWDIITSSSAQQGPLQQAEAALKALREAKDPEARRRAAASLEAAAKKLREQPQKPRSQGGKR